MENNKRCQLIKSIVIKSVIILLIVVGLISLMTTTNFMSESTLLYYTVQSNILVGAIIAVFLIFDIIKLIKKAEVKLPKFLCVIRLVGTSAIAVTFVVFSLMMLPTLIQSGYGMYLLSLNNICLHILVPIIAVVDWFMFDYGYKSNHFTFLYGGIMPMCYLIFVMICSVSGVTFADGSIVPYFFLNYETLGWFSIGSMKLGVFYWIVLLTIVVLLISFFLSFVKEKINAKKISEQNPENN